MTQYSVHQWPIIRLVDPALLRNFEISTIYVYRRMTRIETIYYNSNAQKNNPENKIFDSINNWNHRAAN